MTETQDADQAREELKRFGVRLRDRRILAKLSRRTVAERSSMSECTIKFIESARTRPKLETIVALMRVPELGLQLEDLPSLLRERVREVLALPRGSVCTRQPSTLSDRPGSCSVTAEHCH